MFLFPRQDIKAYFLADTAHTKNPAVMGTWLIFVCVHIRVYSFHLASDWLNNHKIHSLDLLSENRASFLLRLIKHTFLYWMLPNELFRFPWTSDWVISEIHVHTQNKFALWCVFECVHFYLKKLWFSTQTFHSLLADRWFWSLNPTVLSNCSVYKGNIETTKIITFFPPQKNLELHKMEKRFFAHTWFNLKSVGAYMYVLVHTSPGLILM